MPSGSSPVFTTVIVFKVFKSKTVDVEFCPLLVNPRPRSGATAIPWIPGVLGILPTTLSESKSITSTCAP